MHPFVSCTEYYFCLQQIWTENGGWGQGCLLEASISLANIWLGLLRSESEFQPLWFLAATIWETVPCRTELSFIFLVTKFVKLHRILRAHSEVATSEHTAAMSWGSYLKASALHIVQTKACFLCASRGRTSLALICKKYVLHSLRMAVISIRQL